MDNSRHMGGADTSMSGHGDNRDLNDRVEAMVQQGIQETREKELNEVLGGAVDLGSTETCKLCDTTYVKTLPGDNICGACQIAMAVGLVWRQVLYHRWGVIPVRTGG